MLKKQSYGLVALYLILFSTLCSAYTSELTLPAKSEYRKMTSNGQMSVSYPGTSPIPTINPGESVRVKIIVPAGVKAVSIGAASNNWRGNGPGKQVLVGTFVNNPGDICVGGNTQGCISPFQQLDSIGESELSERIVRIPVTSQATELNMAAVPDEQPFNAYVIFYNPANSTSLTIGSTNIVFFVTNFELYNSWLSRDNPVDTTPVQASLDKAAFVFPGSTTTTSTIEYNYNSTLINTKNPVADSGNIQVDSSQFFDLKTQVKVDAADISRGPVNFFVLAWWQGINSAGEPVDLYQFKKDDFLSSWTDVTPTLDLNSVPIYYQFKQEELNKQPTVTIPIGAGVLRVHPQLQSARNRKIVFATGYIRQNADGSKSYVTRLSANYCLDPC